jgi:8-oxo-dGTP pyrophosphatase MutT (NUDIX family)
LKPLKNVRLGKLSEEAIREALHASPQPPTTIRKPIFTLPPEMRRRNAAVLAPLIAAPDGWQVLFTRRTDTVADHKGQVSFPGGAVEAGDGDPADTATREAWEEIGLPRGQTQICGYLDNLLTISGFTVTPVIGIIPWPFEIKLSEGEVSRVFTIPLDWLADENNYYYEFYDDDDPAMSRNVVYYKTYAGEVVWGLTAMITLDLVQRLLQAE